MEVTLVIMAGAALVLLLALFVAVRPRDGAPRRPQDIFPY